MDEEEDVCDVRYVTTKRKRESKCALRWTKKRRGREETMLKDTSETYLIFVVANDDADVVEEEVLGLLCGWDCLLEADGVASRDVAGVLVAHRHGERVEQPVHAVLVVDHVFEFVDILLFVDLAT
jgi:hypothetical protein